MKAKPPPPVTPPSMHAGAPAVPADLIFDDGPIGPALTGDSVWLPTPACALDLWNKNIDRSDAVARAVVAILSRDTAQLEGFVALDELEQSLRKSMDHADAANLAYSSERAACQVAFGALAQTRGKFEEAESLYRSACNLQKKGLGAGHQETRNTTERLAQLLEQIGRRVEAEQIRRAQATDQLIYEGGSLEVLRASALELFVNRQYLEAEGVYRHLLNHGFELASTHCHIARVCLITDRAHEAAEEAERAWKHRIGAPAYMIPRILFIQTLCGMLSAEPVNALLQQINRALIEPGACHVWTMQPVIDHLKARFSRDQCFLLEAMADALGDSGKMRELNQVPNWVAATGNM